MQRKFFVYIDTFSDALAAADEDDSVNIVAITGEGEFYSSGNDLSAFMSQHSNIEEVMATSRKILRSMIHAYIKFSKVLICVVNGPCIGIAATTAVLSDVLYASDTVSVIECSLVQNTSAK